MSKKGGPQRLPIDERQKSSVGNIFIGTHIHMSLVKRLDDLADTDIFKSRTEVVSLALDIGVTELENRKDKLLDAIKAIRVLKSVDGKID